MNQSLYQLNTKAYLATVTRGATLDDIPDSLLESLAKQGFDWLWLLGVWSIGPTGREISRSRPEWRHEYQAALPDLSDNDICGSPFAVCGYTVDSALGGDAALLRVRERLSRWGLKLLLDFVPNHVGLDHPWVQDHPEYFIRGSENELRSDPGRWVRVSDGSIYAYGRDPNYPGWPDTLQLNYFNPDLRAAMVREIESIAARADGIRCDMAMLLEPEIFMKTWGAIPSCKGNTATSFWPEAIQRVRQNHPNFIFMAEVYWDYEYKLQQHGFDFTYDKTLYDRVLHRNGPHLRGHLIAPLSYQSKMARFLENHDEPRIASKLTPLEHRAAAVVTFLAPGLRFFHDGQFTGKKIRIPVHLGRGPREKPVPEISELYHTLLPIIQSPTSKSGTWHLLDTRQAWGGNPTNENFICYLLEHPLETLLVVVNYASYRGQCFVRLPDRAWLEGSIEFRDKLSHERLVRAAADLRERGLFLDCAEWQTHIFVIDHQ